MARSQVATGDRQPRPRGTSDAAVTRRLIVVAAARLFAERGYAAASLSDIVEACNLTKGAVYWHFKSKEDLALDIVQGMYKSWPPLLMEVEAEHDNLLSALVAITYRAAEQFTTDPLTQAAKRLLAELPKEALTRLPRPYVGWERALADLITRGQGRAQISGEVAPEATAQVIVASFFGLQQVSYELSGRRDLRQRLDAFWLLVQPQLSPAERK